jgi:hypothetical protein
MGLLKNKLLDVNLLDGVSSPETIGRMYETNFWGQIKNDSNPRFCQSTHF